MFKNALFKQIQSMQNRSSTWMLPWIVCVSLGMISPAQAEVKVVKNYSTVTANISATDITRIAVVGDRITVIRGAQNAYIVSNDVTQGAVFLKPILPTAHALCPKMKKNTDQHKSKQSSLKVCPRPSPIPKPFYVFVSTEQNRNYVLLLTPQRHQVADLLVLKPLETEQSAALAWEKSDRYSQVLIQLAAALIHGQPPAGYHVTPLSQDFSFGSQITLHLAQRVMGDQLTADIYQVTNQAHYPVSLTESAFYQAGDRAIFLKKRKLAPNESTDLIKIRSTHA